MCSKIVSIVILTSNVHFENNLLDAGLDLMDKTNSPISAKLKIALSGISGPIDNIMEFMDEVDASVQHLPSTDIINNVSMLGPALQLTKQIIDNISKVWN